MSQSKSQKNEIALMPAEAAEFLRRLAGQLEAGGVEFGEVLVETDGPVKIKQSVKTKSDSVSFKLKLKYETALIPDLNGALDAIPEEEPGDEDQAGQEPASGQEPEETQASQEAEEPKKEKKPAKSKSSFKSLKKKMGKDFKSIKKALAEDKLPAREDIEAFAAHCEAMTSFPGKGDEQYDDFMHHVEDMKNAAEKGDAKALARSIAELGAVRKSCHSDYK